MQVVCFVVVVYYNPSSKSWDSVWNIKKTEWKTIGHRKCFRCLNILLFHEKLILNLMATIPCCWWEQQIAENRSVTWLSIKRSSRRCFSEVKMSRCLPINRELCANYGSISEKSSLILNCKDFEHVIIYSTLKQTS